MNREQAKKLLPIIEAFANGEVIQYKFASGEWRELDFDDYRFDSNTENYRIKPRPRECWVAFGGCSIKAIGLSNSTRINYVKMREVTDETDM